MPGALRLKLRAKEDEYVSGGALFSLLIYCAFTFPFFWYALTVWKEVGPILITGLFAAFGVLGAVMTLRLGASKSKFGEVRMWLDAKPAVGGRLQATLNFSRHVAGLVTVRANLVCSEVTYNGQNRKETPLKGVARTFPIRGGTLLPRAAIVMDIPGGLPASNPGIAWELKIVSEVPGIDLERSYALEVGPPEPGVVHPPLPPEASAAPAAADPGREDVMAPPDRGALWLLVLLNLVPLAGVWFFGWKVRDVVMLYWFENLVIGFFNLARIAVAQPGSLHELRRKGVEMSPGELAVAKLGLAIFFVGHYGAFCAAHAEALAGVFKLGGPGERGAGAALAAVFDDGAGKLAALCLVLVHACSFLRNYLGRGEYRQADIADLMMRPYKRIFVVHLFVIAGGLAVVALGDSRAVVAVFVAAKIAVDAWAHRAEHRKALAGAS